MVIAFFTRRTWLPGIVCALVLMNLFFSCPADAQAVHELEPNDRDSEAMVVSPGTTVNGTWSYARAKETRRGTDRDTYRLTNFSYPGTYTFTVTPSENECKYSFGLTNFRGPFSGAVTLSVKIEAQNRVTVQYTGGGQPDHTYVVYDKDPLNNRLLFLEPTFWNSDKDGGFQCVKDGSVRQEIPYQLAISGAAAQSKGEPALGAGSPCRPELEPNDRDSEAMVFSPSSCVEGGWSYARAKETRRGTDRDTYRLTNFSYPGTYTFTVTPSENECKYSFGLTNFRGPFSGAVTLSVKIEAQNRVTVQYIGGGQPDYRHVVYDEDPLNNKLLFLEPTFWNSDREGGFQCVKDGRIYRNIAYRLTASTAAGAVDTAGRPSTGTGSNLSESEAPLRQPGAREITLSPGTTWEAEFPAAATFNLNARIRWNQAAGAASLLEVRVNGQPIIGGLTNKSGTFRLADGREFPYYAESVHAWTIFYSPDFSTNNSSAGDIYQVVTNPGQAYRYQWNTGLIGGPPMKVTIKHNGLIQAPIVIQFFPRPDYPLHRGAGSYQQHFNVPNNLLPRAASDPSPQEGIEAAFVPDYRFRFSGRSARTAAPACQSSRLFISSSSALSFSR